MKIGQINPVDRRFWPSEPEPGFSPERNKQVIESTIKKCENQRARKKRDFVDKLQERTYAIASWLTSSHGALSMKPMEKYFTKRYLAYLRGQQIVEELKRKLSPHEIKLPQVLDSKGNIKGINVQKEQRKEHPKKKRHSTDFG